MLPVFIFAPRAEDTAASAAPVLIDDRQQAVAARGLVVAVRSPGGASAPRRVGLDERCDGGPMEIDPTRIQRPLLAAALEAGWGVSPSGTAWSPAHNASVATLAWAVGRTPFAPYSSRAELSFAIRDAASRHALHAVAAEVVAEVHALGTYYGEYGKGVDDVLGAAEHLLFLRRLNVLSYKLGRARSYLSLFNYRYAQYYLHSTWHDLKAMRAVLEAAGAALQSHVVCKS